MKTAEIMGLIPNKDTAVKIMVSVKAKFYVARTTKIAPSLMEAFLEQGLDVSLTEGTANSVIDRLEKKSGISF